MSAGGSSGTHTVALVTNQSRSIRRMLTVFAVVLGVAGLAACGDDDATTDEGTDTSTDSSEVAAGSELPDCLDLLDLYALTGPESTDFRNWSDANELAAEIGAPGAPYPDLPLTIAGPGEESGTYDSYVELVIKSLAEERGIEDVNTRVDYQSSPSDNVIVQNLEAAPDSLGWVGYAYFAAEQDKLTAFALSADGGECVAPTPESIAAGDYPLSRSLYIYVNNASAAEKGSVSAFVDAFLDDHYPCVADSGYVALDDTALEASRTAAADVLGGEDDGSDVVVSGSSTVEPISACVLNGAGLKGSVEGPGTGDGFKRFCAGETDISDASRTIKDDEAATCEENGVEYTEIEIGIDGMAVMTAKGA
jgi:ABC-type phosphate transport system substrate-binding protein